MGRACVVEGDQNKRGDSVRASDSASLGCEPTVVLCGDREAVVYGCRRILLYTAEEIRFLVRRRCVCVLGRGLVCSSFSGGTVTVEGCISSIRYDNVGEGERLR